MNRLNYRFAFWHLLVNRIMGHIWEAEHEVDPDLALLLIQDQFPELNAKKIQLLGVGWDNTAYLIDGVYVFRFPRREIALALLEAEAEVLPKIASVLLLEVPQPEWMGKPGGGYPWPFSGYRKLSGKTACHFDLSDEERAGMAEPLAVFLSKLHSLPLPKNIQTDPLDRLNPEKLIAKIDHNLEELALLGLMGDVKRLYREGEYPIPKEGILVHGDLYVRHLLLDESRKLTGVIDWGDVHSGDPAVDLAIAHSFLPGSAHENFCNAYGRVEKDTWRLARLRALYHSSTLMLYGHHSGDEAIIRECLRSIETLSI
ncbi:MAG: hypothetical protein KR126chlam1_00513 [Chlamydiae bacterium]|nr:hypothetical protein [Chlamydiota bacterium]